MGSPDSAGAAVNVLPLPWGRVDHYAVVLGRDGKPVQLGMVHQTGADTVISWNGTAVIRPSAEIVPVVLPGEGEALIEIFRAFPATQVLQVTHGFGG